jgi:hypothetical protein
VNENRAVAFILGGHVECVVIVEPFRTAFIFQTVDKSGSKRCQVLLLLMQLYNGLAFRLPAEQEPIGPDDRITF